MLNKLLNKLLLPLIMLLGTFLSAQSNTIADIVKGSESHMTLETALNAAELMGALEDTSANLTLFAPTDSAFSLLPEGTVEALLADTATLKSILLYHVVGSKAMSGDLSDGQKIMTLQGKDILITINNDGVFINDAQVTLADQEADNGVVHIIDAVMLPPTSVADIVKESDKHNTLEVALDAAELMSALDDVAAELTLFAPTDSAFSLLPEGTVEALLADTATLKSILLYHVVGSKAMSGDLSDGQKIMTLQGKDILVTINNDGVFINDAMVTMADVEADNGVVHIIDAVMLPPTSVADIVKESDKHNTLEVALDAAELMSALDDVAAELTLFAPTDSAFSLLPEGTIEALLADTATLKSILLYHVVGSKAMSGDLSDGQKIMTLQGKDILVTINNDGVFINDAMVTMADVEADNGVAHIIDAVMLPPTSVADIVKESDKHNTLEVALDAAELMSALDDVAAELTLFAPTDSAFSLLPEGTIEALLADTGTLKSILLYHVVGSKAMSGDLSDGQKIMTLQGKDILVTINNDGVFINDAMVTMADIEADNGVVHIIDAVMLPPTSVADIVKESENHTTLEAALDAAELMGALDDVAAELTLFAPTDSAFALLPEGTIEALLADTGTLKSILLYHVVGSKAMSGDLSDQQLIKTLQGNEIQVTINNDGVFINAAKVTIANIEADNGVVHVINAVLSPDDLTGFAPISKSEDLKIFPNPASSYIHLTLPKGYSNGYPEVKLLDATGKTVLAQLIDGQLSNPQLNVSNVESGLYFLILTHPSSNTSVMNSVIIR